MSLNPFGRTQEPLLFAVPRAQDDRSLWPPPLLEQVTKRAAGFHERDLAACRIVGSINPRVVMIAEDHPLIGKGAPADASDHVVERLHRPIKRDLQMDS